MGEDFARAHDAGQVQRPTRDRRARGPTQSSSYALRLPAPTGLIATAVSKTQINLTWVDQSNNESGFRIERSTVSGSGYTVIATVGANTTSYANTGLKTRKNYYYRVRAYNGSGDSTYSNTATAKTFK